MRIDIAETPQGFVVRLGGEGGYLAAGTLQGPLTSLMARRAPLVVVDMAELEFIASLVLGVLVGFRRSSARHGGQVRLVGLKPAVRETFEAAGLLALFCVAATVEEALIATVEEPAGSAGAG